MSIVDLFMGRCAEVTGQNVSRGEDQMSERTGLDAAIGKTVAAVRRDWGYDDPNGDYAPVEITFTDGMVLEIYGVWTSATEGATQWKWHGQ